MKGFFSIDGWFAHYGAKLWDLIWLNILTILFSLPVITMTASLTAMHYVLLKIFRDEEQGITKAFLKSFRQNFLQTSIIGLLMIGIYYLLITAIVYFHQQNSVMLYVSIVVVVVISCVFAWTIILLSRYQISMSKIFQHALAACLGHPGRSVLIGVLAVIPFFLLLFTWKMIVPIIIGGLSIPGIVQTLLYNDVFKKLEKSQEE